MGSHGPIKYRFDDHFFDELDRDAPAYWLGFIAADGTISRSALSVSLAERDICILERLKADLRADQPIAHYAYPAKGLAFCRLALSSKHLVASLGRWGIVPNKTFSLRMPPIPPRLMGAFLRGVFDGDGSVYVSGKSCPRYVVRITANHGFAGDIVDALAARGIAARARPEYGKRATVSNVTIDALRSVIAFRTFVYADASFWLARKREKLDQIGDPSDDACINCGEPAPQRRFRERRRFCSKACYQRWYRAQRH